MHFHLLYTVHTWSPDLAQRGVDLHQVCSKAPYEESLTSALSRKTHLDNCEQSYILPDEQKERRRSKRGRGRRETGRRERRMEKEKET